MKTRYFDKANFTNVLNTLFGAVIILSGFVAIILAFVYGIWGLGKLTTMLFHLPLTENSVLWLLGVVLVLSIAYLGFLLRLAILGMAKLYDYIFPEKP